TAEGGKGPSVTDSIPHQLGLLMGTVNGISTRLTGVEEALTKLREANTADHASVVARVDQLRHDLNEGLATRARREEVGKLEVRGDALEAERDQRSGQTSGRTQVLRFTQGALAAALAIVSILALTGVLG